MRGSMGIFRQGTGAVDGYEIYSADVLISVASKNAGSFTSWDVPQSIGATS